MYAYASTTYKNYQAIKTCSVTTNVDKICIPDAQLQESEDLVRG